MSLSIPAERGEKPASRDLNYSWSEAAGDRVGIRETIAVAIIESVGGHGGMDHYDLGLARGLAAAGCRVSLYTGEQITNPASPCIAIYPEFKGVYGRSNRWLRAFRFLRGSVSALARATIHREKICHLHLFHGETQELALVILSKLCRRKVVITVHDVESFAPVTTSRSLIGRVYGLADRLIVHNQISKRELVEKLKISPTKISVIAAGNYMMDLGEAPSQAYARRSLGISEESRVILFFGQIKDVKGLDILIEAIPAVAREVPEVTLIIAGRPWKSGFAPYETLIDALGIRSRCVLHIRYIPNDEIARYFASADVVVLPYRRIYQSGVVLMAMSYGRPAVVSDLPGMTEMITDGENGYVFAQGSKDALAEKLIRVLRDGQGREETARRALEYIRRHHDWDKIGKATSELYSSILRG